MKCLIVDDNFVARKLLLRFLSEIGICDIAVDGREAVDAFKDALRGGDRYDLICLDIMMPQMDGHQVLKAMRKYEEANDIYGHDGVKIIMITALDTPKHIVNAFREGCEAYIVKPVRKTKLFEEVNKLGLSVTVS
jgi:two-component system, chemotaxis family, chemotaxis protein CheY